MIWPISVFFFFKKYSPPSSQPRLSSSSGTELQDGGSPTMTVLRGTAHWLSYLMSVADAERRHNRHKRITQKSQGYAGFTAKSQLEEFRAHSVRTARHVLAVIYAVSDAGNLPASSGEAPASKGPVAARPRKRGQSACEAFVDEKKRELESTGISSRMLFFDKEVKKRLRDEWAAKPADERLGYKLEAAPKSHALPQHAAPKRRALEPPPEQAAVVDGASESVVLWAGASGEHRLERLAATRVAALAHTPILGIGPLWSVGEDPDMLSVKRAESQPLHPAILQETVTKRKFKKIENEKNFDAKMTDPSVDDRSVPKKVRYPRLCCQWCSSFPDNRDLLAMRKRLLKIMAGFVNFFCTKYNCKPPMLARKQLMLCVEVVFPAHRHMLLVMQLSLANKASGPHAAWQGFVNFELPDDFSRMQPSGAEFSLVDVVVEPRPRTHIACRNQCARDFLESPAEGPLNVLSMDQVADIALAPIAQASRAERKTLSIVITLVSHRPVHDAWDHRQCIGADTTWGADRFVVRESAPGGDRGCSC